MPTGLFCRANFLLRLGLQCQRQPINNFRGLMVAPFKTLRTALGLRRRKPKDIWPWDGIKIGRHTYGVLPQQFFSYDSTVSFEIGNFCSVANEVIFWFGQSTRTEVFQRSHSKLSQKGLENLRAKARL